MAKERGEEIASSSLIATNMYDGRRFGKAIGGGERSRGHAHALDIPISMTRQRRGVRGQWQALHEAAKQVTTNR